MLLREVLQDAGELFTKERCRDGAPTSELVLALVSSLAYCITLTCKRPSESVSHGVSPAWQGLTVQVAPGGALG
jgi:hypothetical protein